MYLLVAILTVAILAGFGITVKTIAPLIPDTINFYALGVATVALWVALHLVRAVSQKVSLSLLPKNKLEIYPQLARKTETDRFVKQIEEVQ